MSRILVNLCTILLIHQHLITTSCASNADFATAFEISKYEPFIEEISIIGRTHTSNVFTMDGQESYMNTMEQIKNITVTLRNMMRNNDVYGNNYDKDMLKFPLIRTMDGLLHNLEDDLQHHRYPFNILEGTTFEDFFTYAKNRYIIRNRGYFNETLHRFSLKLKNELSIVAPAVDKAIRCDLNFSLLQTYLKTFHIIIILELQSYLMYVYPVFMHHYVTSAGYNFHSNADFHYDDREMITSDINKFRDVILNFLTGYAPNGIYECTTGEPIRGEETIEFEGIFQKFITSKPDANGDNHSTQTCSIGAPLLPSLGFSIYDSHRTEPCRGEITSCLGVKGIQICYANDSSIKRYEGLSYNQQTYGNLSSCPGVDHTTNGLLQWLLMCEAYLCTCSTNTLDSKRTQTLSYAEQTSDIEKNKVITNIKFVEKNKTIHLQIEQKELSSSECSTCFMKREWKPINDENVEVKQVRNMQRVLHLDEVIVPQGHLVTGVKFGPYEPPEGLLEGSYHKFQIRVRATPYDQLENKLITSKDGVPTSFWVTPQTMDTTSRDIYNQDRTSVYGLNLGDLYELPVATRTLPDSTPNQYIAFRNSDMQDDAGQSTIPYFDSRPAFSKEPFPLIGVGISLKGYNGAIGYLTLKTIPYVTIN